MTLTDFHDNVYQERSNLLVDSSTEASRMKISTMDMGAQDGSAIPLELQATIRHLKGIAFGSMLVSAVAMSLAATTLLRSSQPSAPERSQITPSEVQALYSKFNANATTGLWSGPDNVIVPYGFSECDSTAMPPQIAPVRVAGDFLFLSGILGYNTPCESAHPDIDKQIELAFHWADVTLRAAKSSWKDIMMVTSYHVGMKKHIKKFTEMRSKYLADGIFPAWTSVEVSKLFFDHEVFEMTMIGRKAPCNNLECR